MLLSRMLYARHVRSAKTDARRFPVSYADDSVDRAVRAHLSDGPGTQWAWPRGKRCVLVLSHDTDTAGQHKGIRRLAQLAEKRSLVSTFTIVGRNLGHYAPLLQELGARGHEIALHDVQHDNRVAHLAKDQINRRLAAMDELRERLGIVGFRSPSWYTSPTLWQALGDMGFLYDMSALDTWSFFDPSRNYGVATFLPFVVDRLVVLPNTIPFETPLYFGYSKLRYLEYWQEKIDRIAAQGGLIMINAHPDRWFCGSRAGVDSLTRCVDYILERHDPACMRACDVARHVLAQKDAGATIALDGSPIVHVPRRGDAQ